MSEVELPAVLYKLLTPQEWEVFQRSGEYSGSRDDVRDGFIHLSCEHQMRGTWVKHFQSQPDVVVVSISTAKMAAELRFEASRGGELFPHLYRVLSLSEVLTSRLADSIYSDG